MSLENQPSQNHSFSLKIPDGDERERLVCNSCEFVHYENPKIVVGSVCVWEGVAGDEPLFLMCRRGIEPRKGYWTIPAGFLEEKETPAQGAAREAWEEARATIDTKALLAVYSIPRISQVQMMYVATLQSPDIAVGPESTEVALLRWDDIPWDDIAFPSVYWALAHYRQIRAQDVFAPFTNPDGQDGDFDLESAKAFAQQTF